MLLNNLGILSLKIFAGLAMVGPQVECVQNGLLNESNIYVIVFVLIRRPLSCCIFIAITALPKGRGKLSGIDPHCKTQHNIVLKVDITVICLLEILGGLASRC